MKPNKQGSSNDSTDITILLQYVSAVKCHIIWIVANGQNEQLSQALYTEQHLTIFTALVMMLNCCH